MNHISDIQLNDYVDNDLSPDARAAVQQHCAECAECAQRVERLGSLRLRLAELPRSIEPPPSIHAEIRAQLDAPLRIPVRRGVSRRTFATAAVVLVALSSATTVMVMRSMRDDVASPTLARDNVPGDARLIAVTEIESRYISAIDELQRALDAQRALLAPETIKLVESNLEIIDRAVAEARNALLADPSSAVLADMLRAGYERKLDVLRSARAHTVQM